MSSPPAHRGARHRRSGLRFSTWNLVLLAPLIVLITPLYNTDQPRLIGIPYFYWYQLLFVFVGVLSVAIVYAATREVGGPDARAETPEPSDVDTLDEGGVDDD